MSSPTLAERVDRNEQDVGASQRAGTRKAAIRRAAARGREQQRNEDPELRIADCGLRIPLWISLRIRTPQSNPQSAIRNPQCL